MEEGLNSKSKQRPHCYKITDVLTAVGPENSPQIKPPTIRKDHLELVPSNWHNNLSIKLIERTLSHMTNTPFRIVNAQLVQFFRTAKSQTASFICSKAGIKCVDGFYGL